jgi:transcriptional regulator with XRE-family HTH domain
MAQSSNKTKSIDKREYEVVTGLLRTLRLRAELTQQELGEALGRRQGFVSQCELGARRLDTLQVREWCQACGTSYTDFARRLDETLELLASTTKPQKKKRRPG